MKLTMTKVLTPIAALAFAFGAQAAAVATDGFETETSTVVTNRPGWSFTYGSDGADDASVITAYDNNEPAQGIIPDAFSGDAGNNYLKLSTEDGTLLRNLDANVNSAGLFVDTDVQFTITDKDDRPEISSADKFIIWLEADTEAHTTNLCAWAREYVSADTTAMSSNVFTLATASQIVPGQWYRLTVKAIANANSEQTSGLVMPGFQVYLDGTLLTTSEFVATSDQRETFLAGIGTTASTLIAEKKFLPAMNVTSAMETLASVGFSGEGMLDNLAVTPDIPGYLPSAQITLDWDDTTIASVSIPALGIANATKGYKFTMAPGATFTTVAANITLQDGKGSVSDYSFTWSQNGAAVDIDGLTVTAKSGLEVATESTLTLNSVALNTVNVTLACSELRGIATVSYSINGGEATSFTPSIMVSDATIENCGFGTNIEITVTFTGDDYAANLEVTTGAGSVTLNGNVATIVSRPSGGAATITITPVTPVAKVNGTSYATFAEAFAAAKTAGYPVELCGEVTLTAAQEVAQAETVTVDLKGYTITGAEGAAAFSNAGTLTITDTSTDHDGSVAAGTGGSVVANTGALSLVYGTYAGTFTNSGTFTITADCSFDNDLSGAYTPATGYAVAETGTGVYKLAAITYTITYKKGDAEITPTLSPATYTVAEAVTLPTAEADAGYEFTGWKDASDNTVESWSAGAKTGNLVLTAQFSATSYTITFVPGDGATVVPASTNYTITSGAITLPTPTLSGYTFNGWTNETITAAITSFTPDGTNLDDFTLYAKWTSSGSSYPSYLESADSTVKAQYDTWAKANSVASGDNEYEAAFLLNVAPDATDQTLDTSAVAISGTTVTLTMDHTSFNGYVYVKSASTLAGLDTATATQVTPENGVITLTSQSGTAAFYKVIVSATPITASAN